ncbi:MAG: hypothetical protein EOP10_23985 [Proteobacteria bacterium]|nr:MAG: hypothetical protein EOP10_23985 [Pseudomonadota bacterium]
MLLRLFIPITVFVLIQSFQVLDQSADLLFANFTEDYQDLVCARRDVYEHNLEDGARYLRTRFPYLEERPMDIEQLLHDGEEEGVRPIDCESAAYAIYREGNAKLPSIYPNWLAIEASRGKEELSIASDETE